jgi:hypothetical protein
MIDFCIEILQSCSMRSQTCRFNSRCLTLMNLRAVHSTQYASVPHYQLGSPGSRASRSQKDSHPPHRLLSRHFPLPEPFSYKTQMDALIEASPTESTIHSSQLNAPFMIDTWNVLAQHAATYYRERSAGSSGCQMGLIPMAVVLNCLLCPYFTKELKRGERQRVVVHLFRIHLQ